MYNLTKVVCKPYKTEIAFLVVLHLIILSKLGANVNEIICLGTLFPPYKQYRLLDFVQLSHNI